MSNAAMNASPVRRSGLDIKVSKIGMVTRDYNVVFPNGYRDFSHVLPAVLQLLDEAGCDLVLFSLYSLIPRPGYDPRTAFAGLKNIKLICVEQFRDGKRGRKAGKVVVYYKTESGWRPYRVRQLFGQINRQSHRDAARRLAEDELPRRVFGNCCLIVCGESNGVKYSREDKLIHDTYGLRAAIPSTVKIILNPVHDRMSRFEMMRKRQFLSAKGRWVISAWNRGKLNEQGRTRDGSAPAWTVFHDGKLVLIPRLENNLDVDVGVIDISKISTTITFTMYN